MEDSTVTSLEHTLLGKKKRIILTVIIEQIYSQWRLTDEGEKEMCKMGQGGGGERS